MTNRDRVIAWVCRAVPWVLLICLVFVVTYALTDYTAWLAMAGWGFLSCIVFIVAYGYKQRRRWYRAPMGRHLMAFSVALGATYGLMVISLVWGPLGAGPWKLGLLAVNLVLSQRLWYLFTKGWIRDPLVTGAIKTTDGASEGRPDYGAH